MNDLLIDVMGVATGLAVYAAWRAVRSRSDGRRHRRLDTLLAPYHDLPMRPLPVRVELPANVIPLRRAR